MLTKRVKLIVFVQKLLLDNLESIFSLRNNDTGNVRVTF